MSNRIPLEELNHQLNGSFQKLEQWSKERVSGAQKLKTSFKENEGINAGDFQVTAYHSVVRGKGDHWLEP